MTIPLDFVRTGVCYDILPFGVVFAACQYSDHDCV